MGSALPISLLYTKNCDCEFEWEHISFLIYRIKTVIQSPEIMDRFWCSRCLNDRIEVPKMMGSFPGGSTTPLEVKSGTKQTWWKVGFFFSSIHASWKLLYSHYFSSYMKMVNSTWFYGPGSTTFAHKVLISTTFVTQSFDLKMTYFCCWHSPWILLLFRCKLLNKT